MLLGFGWSCFQGNAYLEARPESSHWRLKIIATPTQSWGTISFKAQLLCTLADLDRDNRCRSKHNDPLGLPYYLSVTNSNHVDEPIFSTLRPGDIIAASLVVNPLNHLANPGFDRYRWWLTQRVVAEASIVELIDPPVLANDGLSHWRYQLAERLNIESAVESSALSGLPLFPLLKALALGDRQNLTNDHWRLFRETGTSHLVAISGLHLGLISGWFYWLALIACRLLPALNRRIYPSSLAAIIAVMVASFYAVISGFSLPTQRAFLMLCCGLLMVAIGRPKLVLKSILFALAVMLFIQPFAVFSASLWLSFGAMVLVFWAIANYIYMAPGWIQKFNQLLRVQWFIFVSMVPMSLYFFDGVSLNSFVANVFAIPLVTFIILPLTLVETLSVFFMSSAPRLMVDLNLALLDFFLVGLQNINELIGGYQTKSIDLSTFLMMLVGGMLACSPFSKLTKILGIVIYIMMLCAPDAEREMEFVAFNNSRVLFELKVGGERWLFAESAQRNFEERKVVAAIAPHFIEQQFYWRDLWSNNGWVVYPLHKPQSPAIELCNAPLSTKHFMIEPILIGDHCLVRLSGSDFTYLLVGKPDLLQQREIVKSKGLERLNQTSLENEYPHMSAIFMSAESYFGGLLNHLSHLSVVVWHSDLLSAKTHQRFISRKMNLTQMSEQGTISWAVYEGLQNAQTMYPSRFYHKSPN
ncbi:MAG: ComEC/Rec2 family competence protein [Pseudomonadales bacterium]|nr:ComEC/Rec2 family competence protein [Pseudomonadales bacterium]